MKYKYFEPKVTRAKHDYYTTPRRAVTALLNRVTLAGSIWEPACGAGHIAKYLPGNVIATDLVNRGYGKGGVDFLKHILVVDCIVTNPPFNLAFEFAKHALRCANKKVCLLLPLYFLAHGRTDVTAFLNRQPPRFIFVFSGRLQFGRNGTDYPIGSPFPMGWFVWHKHFNGDTTLKLICKE